MTPQEMLERDKRDIEHLKLISTLLGGVRIQVNGATFSLMDPEAKARAARDMAILDKIRAYEAEGEDSDGTI